MTRFAPILAAIALAIAPLSANAWEEPARGTALRGNLMDAVRPHAEWVLGAPVIFVVNDLRVSGDVGVSGAPSAPATMRARARASVRR